MTGNSKMTGNRSNGRRGAARLRLVTPAELNTLVSHGDGGDWSAKAESVLGCCGVRLDQGEQCLGYLLLAAPGNAPDPSPVHPGLAMSADAVPLVGVWVHPDYRRAGIGRRMVQRAAAIVRRRGLPAIEAFASTTGGGQAAPPLGWLERTGFVLVCTHPLHPRLRLDLDRTALWPGWSGVLERIRSTVRGLDAPPHPTSRAAARHQQSLDQA